MRIKENNLTQKLLEDLAKNVDNYIILRNYQALPYSTGGSDLDLFIGSNCVDDFNYFLRDFVSRENLRIVSRIDDNYSPKYCIYGYRWGIQIDVFLGSVCFRGKPIIRTVQLEENRLTFNGLSVLDDKVASLLTLLKEILNNGDVKKLYLDEFNRDWGRSIIDRSLLSQFTDEFIQCLNNSLGCLKETDIRELSRLSKVSFTNSRFFGIRKKLNRVFHKPGFTVAFLGVDGSGKTSIIDDVSPILSKPFHKAVYYEHLRPNRFPSLARLFGKEENFEVPVTNPHEHPTSGLILSLIRWLYYFLDYTLGFYIKVWPRITTRSCVWIFDRYYYDYMIDAKRSRIKLPIWVLKLGQQIIPEPDIIICLGARADLIYSRKPELPLKEIERQVEKLGKFCATHERASWVDTGKSFEDSSNEVLEEITLMMSKRNFKI